MPVVHAGDHSSISGTIAEKNHNSRNIANTTVWYPSWAYRGPAIIYVKILHGELPPDEIDPFRARKCLWFPEVIISIFVFVYVLLPEMDWTPWSPWQLFWWLYQYECQISYQMARTLTHLHLDKMAANSQTTSSNAFYWMKIFEF